FTFGLFDADPEQFMAETLELLLGALEVFGSHEIGHRGRVLDDKQRFMAGLDILNQARQILAELADTRSPPPPIVPPCVRREGHSRRGRCCASTAWPGGPTTSWPSKCFRTCPQTRFPGPTAHLRAESRGSVVSGLRRLRVRAGLAASQRHLAWPPRVRRV